MAWYQGNKSKEDGCTMFFVMAHQYYFFFSQFFRPTRYEFLFYLINVYKLYVNLLKRAPRKIGSANWVTISR